MLTGFLPILIAVVTAFALAIVMSIMARWFGPKKPSLHKSEPYESGIVPDKPVPMRFNIHFYSVAILFIAFDVEMIFVLPWAVAGGTLGIIGFVEMFISIAILGVVYAYALREGILDWNPRRGRIERDDDPWQSGGAE